MKKRTVDDVQPRCIGAVVGTLDVRSEGQWFEAWSLPSRCFLGQES